MPKTVTNILQLPAELIREILLYVPYRFNAASTCILFYQHVCEIEKEYFKLIIITHDQAYQEVLEFNLLFKTFLKQSS